MAEFVPVNEPLLQGNEKKYLAECIDTGWISSEGPFVRKFEELFAARVGRKHGVAVCNGSAALEAAVVLGVSERHAWRILAAYRREGAAAVAHGNRGRRPANATAEDVRRQVIELARTRYVGVNHTHLTELLAEREGRFRAYPGSIYCAKHPDESRNGKPTAAPSSASSGTPKAAPAGGDARAD